jgi:hypothetical protein
MSGKPTLSKNAEHGAAMTTPGLSPLDEEREASMADEGGTAGAQMESQEASEETTQSVSIPPTREQAKPAFRFPHIGLHQHNIRDYVRGAVILSAPSLLGFRNIRPASQTFTAVGAGTIGYSLLSRTPYSPVKLIPLGIHMGLDLDAGIALIAAPYVLGYRNRLKRWQLGAHWLLGLGGFVLVALTRPRTEKQKLAEWAGKLENKFKLAS